MLSVFLLALAGCGAGSDTSRHETGVAGSGAAGSSGSLSSAGSSGGQAGHAGSSSAAGTSGGAGIGTGTAGSGTPAADGGTASTAGPKPFDAGNDPNRNNVMPGDICDRLSEIQCAGEEHCCLNPGRDRATCKTEMFNGCKNTLQLDAIAADKITGFDAAFAATSFTHFEMMASLCDPDVASWGTTVSGLRGILKGTRAPGNSCTPQTTNPNDKAKIGAALASCTNLDTTACLPKSAVSGISLSWSCAPKNAAGGTCVTDVNCNDGLYCNNPQMSIGKCAPRKTPGTPCVNPNECASLFCKGGSCAESGVQPAYCLKN